MLHHAGPGSQLPLSARRGAVASTSGGTGRADGPIPRSCDPSSERISNKSPVALTPSRRLSATLRRCPSDLAGGTKSCPPAATDLSLAAICASDAPSRQGLPGSRRYRAVSVGLLPVLSGHR